MRNLMALLAVTFALTGCSMGADISAAEANIPSFHENLDAGKFGIIYETSSSDFKRATTEAALTQLLSAVHRKLGQFQSGKAEGWNDNVTTSGHFVTVNYAAHYARGTAQENFVYRLDGAAVTLAGYHINSTALILN
jgi:hypothetical protein